MSFSTCCLCVWVYWDDMRVSLLMWLACRGIQRRVISRVARVYLDGVGMVVGWLGYFSSFFSSFSSLSVSP